MNSSTTSCWTSPKGFMTLDHSMGACSLPPSCMDHCLLCPLEGNQVLWKACLLHRPLPLLHPRHSFGPCSHPSRIHGRNHFLPHSKVGEATRDKCLGRCVHSNLLLPRCYLGRHDHPRQLQPV